MQHAQRSTRSPLILMALTIFLDFAGFGLIIPLLPFWAKGLGATSFEVGLLIAVYALAQFLFTPLLGRLSDEHGRRPVILASLGIECLGYVLAALAGSFPLLLLARFIGGLGASNLGSAQAVVADVTPPDRRAKGMGLIGAAIGLGFFVGPAVGGALSAFGLNVPFWVALAVALANALLVWRLLPETHPSGSRPAKASLAVRRNALWLPASWGHLRSQPVLARLVTTNLLYTLAFSGMEAIFPLLTLRLLGWGATANGYVFTYVGVLVVVMQGGLVARLVARLGERRVLIAGLAFLALGLAALPLGGNVAILLFALALVSIGDGAVTPVVSTLLSFAASERAQGEVLGVAQGAAGLGRILGPLLAGVLFARFGAGAPFLTQGLLVIVALVLMLPALPSRLGSARAMNPEPAVQEGATSGGVRSGPRTPRAGSRSLPQRAHASTRLVRQVQQARMRQDPSRDAEASPYPRVSGSRR